MYGEFLFALIQAMYSLYSDTECAAWLGDRSLAIAINPNVWMLDFGEQNTFSPAVILIRFWIPMCCAVFLNTFVL